jgi:hypothetical protein
MVDAFRASAEGQVPDDLHRVIDLDLPNTATKLRKRTEGKALEADYLEPF